MTNCPKARCLIGVIAVFGYLFLAENAFHYCPWMHALYVQTAALWRPMVVIEALVPLIIGRLAIEAVLITGLYKKCLKHAPATTVCATTGEMKKCCPIKRGIGFGAKIGLLIGVINAGAYVYIPIPAQLAIGWLFEGLVDGIGAGIILAIVFNKKECGTKECGAQ